MTDVGRDGKHKLLSLDCHLSPPNYTKAIMGTLLALLGVKSLTQNTQVWTRLSRVQCVLQIVLTQIDDPTLEKFLSYLAQNSLT